MKQVKTKRIEVEYTDGSKVVIEPYIYEGKQGYGFDYFDKKGRKERYEGSWNARRISDWFLEVLEDDSADYDKEFDRIQAMYSP
jgi:hypothetical protein